MGADERGGQARAVLDTARNDDAAPVRDAAAGTVLRRLGWFFALWLGGVAAVSLVAMALRAAIPG